MQEDSLLYEIRRRGILRVAVDFVPPPRYGYPPEFYIDEDTGKPSGFGCELGRLMAQDLGVEVEFVNIPWPEQIPALLAGKVDVLPKHVNTPRRALEIEFAGRLLPYKTIALVAVDGDIHDKADLNKHGRVITCGYGASYRQAIERHFPLASIREFADYDDMLTVVETYEADACVNDIMTKAFMEKHKGLRVLADDRGAPLILARDYAHPAIRPGDPRFLNWLNNWIDYHRAAGLLEYWCGEWWQSFMAV